jgi:CBS domain-containing protein
MNRSPALEEEETPMTIAAILKHKGYGAVSVSPADSIAHVARVLAEHNIGAVLVKDEAERLLGIISERDIVRALPRYGADTLSMKAEDLMSQKVLTVNPEMTVEAAMAMMTKGRFRHLPVVKDGRVIGIASIGDVVKARLMQQEQEMNSLKAYVAGAV